MKKYLLILKSHISWHQSDEQIVFKSISLRRRKLMLQLALYCLPVINFLAVDAASASEMNSALDHTTRNASQTFVDRCQREVAIPAVNKTFRVRHFGDNAHIAALLVNLIAAGEKTGTFTSPWLFEGNRNLTPVPGGYTVVTNFLAQPRLLLQTTSIDTMPFDEISEAETRVDGPTIRPLDVWRKVHWEYFTRELAKLGRTPSQDMPVTVEKFVVICDSNALSDEE